MKDAIRREGGSFTLFGGEALLIPLSDLEAIWLWGYRKFGHNSVQTNGVLISEQHIELFKKYNVHVGVSIDGPGQLNDIRAAGRLKNTRETTAKIEVNIERLCKEGISTSIITTLHRLNATSHHLSTMSRWIRNLDRTGVESIRLHILESEEPEITDKYALSIEENIAAFRCFAELESDLIHLTLDVFTDIRNQLMGQDDQTTCIWNACDPYTTRAVRGVEGHGQRSNCGRTNKDGIDFVKSKQDGFERYIALYQTPQEFGGCQGCRFFLMCKGQCPGTAVDGDWRNRTEHCLVWKTLFTEYEGRLIHSGYQPISDNIPLRQQLEQKIVQSWCKGRNPSISTLLQEMTAAQSSSQNTTTCHGDSPHGDS